MLECRTFIRYPEAKSVSVPEMAPTAGAKPSSRHLDSYATVRSILIVYLINI